MPFCAPRYPRLFLLVVSLAGYWMLGCLANMSPYLHRHHRIRSFHSQHGAPRPSRSLARGPALDPRMSDEEAIFRKVRGILNKLTIEKFEPLVQQLLCVGIGTENVLKVRADKSPASLPCDQHSRPCMLHVFLNVGHYHPPF